MRDILPPYVFIIHKMEPPSCFSYKTGISCAVPYSQNTGKHANQDRMSHPKIIFSSPDLQTYILTITKHINWKFFIILFTRLAHTKGILQILKIRAYRYDIKFSGHLFTDIKYFLEWHNIHFTFEVLICGIQSYCMVVVFFFFFEQLITLLQKIVCC